MDIKISCIIPYHNEDQALLRDCVDSILRQDFADYEILIVNDGSDAAHTADLEAVCGHDSCIRILPGPGRGVSAARNAGVQEARGEYVVFVDADDVVVPYYFSEAYGIAVAHGVDYVVGQNVATHDRALRPERISSPQVVECDAAVFRTDFLVVTAKTGNGGYFGRGPVARLIRREVVRRTSFPENVSMGEDSIWNMDVLAMCDKVCKVYQIWYLYWQHSSSACHRYEENMVAIVEEHLWEMARRIDFEKGKEAEAYFLRMYEFLRQQVFSCYLGRKECPLPVFQRARAFRALCKKAPWDLYEGHMEPRYCARRTRGKRFLLRSGLLYWFWFVRSHVSRERTN